MAVLMTLEGVLAELNAMSSPLIGPTRRDSTTSILKLMLAHADKHALNLTGEAVSAVSRDYCRQQKAMSSLTQKQAAQRVFRVAQTLNHLPGVVIQLPPQPITLHRPTSLPTSSGQLGRIDQMKALDQQLLTLCRQQDALAVWLTAFAWRLSTRLGMGERVAVGTLAYLRKNSVSEEHWLEIPSQPYVGASAGITPAVYPLQLTEGCWIPLRALLSRSTAAKDEWFLAPACKRTAPIPLKERENWLRKQLQLGTQRLLKAWRAMAGRAASDRLAGWKRLASEGRFIALHRGVPPLWIELLQRYPLPTSTPVPLLAASRGASRYRLGETHGRLPSARAQLDVTAPVENLREPGALVPDLEGLPEDWFRQIKLQLSQFLNAADALPGKRLNTQAAQKPLQTLLTQHLAAVEAVTQTHCSYPALLLHWMYYMLQVEGHTLSTARTKLSRLTPTALISDTAVLSLDWDDETIEDLQGIALSECRWRPSTQAMFLATWRQFIAFCQTHGLLSEVTVPPHQIDQPVSTLRTRIISPTDFRDLWTLIAQGMADGDLRQMLGLVLALGFFAGLRASEVEGLTLADVRIEWWDQEGGYGPMPDRLDERRDSRPLACWVTILGGKTPAARRKVPLHILAPPEVIEAMDGWIRERRALCGKKRKLAEIGLFGPRGNPLAYERKALIKPAIEAMRQVLGEGIDFHGLRHAAVSWCLLRLHAALHEGMVPRLQHRHEWMFQPESLSPIKTFFCGAEGEATLARGTLLAHVAKWIGHRHQGTLLQHYAHTLSVIHSDVLARAWSNKVK